LSKQTAKIIDKIDIHYKFIEQDFYFDDDKETRNIYKITISFDGKKTSFKFGDSLDDTHKGKMLGDNQTEDKASILETIDSDYSNTKENYPTYKDFASEFGYDEDSIKGLKIYKTCLKQAEKLNKLFNEDQMEQISKELGL